jgi:hypothetical protein
MRPYRPLREALLAEILGLSVQKHFFIQARWLSVAATTDHNVEVPRPPSGLDCFFRLEIKFVIPESRFEIAICVAKEIDPSSCDPRSIQALNDAVI